MSRMSAGIAALVVRMEDEVEPGDVARRDTSGTKCVANRLRLLLFQSRTEPDPVGDLRNHGQIVSDEEESAFLLSLQLI